MCVYYMLCIICIYVFVGLLRQFLLQEMKAPMLVVFHPVFYKKHLNKFKFNLSFGAYVCLQPIFWELKECHVDVYRQKQHVQEAYMIFIFSKKFPISS